MLYPQVFPNHKRPTDEQHAGTIAWGKEKAKTWLTVLDTHFLGKTPYVAGDISIADYFGSCIVTAGELIGCTFEGYPNVQKWLGTMKQLASWPKVNEVMYGFAGSMKGKDFQNL